MHPESKTFSHMEQHHIALCELSYFKEDVVEYLPQHGRILLEGVWYYFNRLMVPPKMRNKGIAKKLLQEMCNWANTDKVSIWLDINPYGDLDLHQLINLYSKFDFQQIADATMIRRYDVLKNIQQDTG
jgi:GNAT superfamily N-acetyltransferase